MKTLSPRRQSVPSAKKSRAPRHHYRAGGNGGNGRATAASRAVAPKVSSSIASWLNRKKNNLIGGRWVPSVSGKTFDVFNPADASVIARVPDSDREDINRAVAAARRAFESGPWRRMTPSERGKYLWRIGDA